jgi:CRP-like cAMP-binding protein
MADRLRQVSREVALAALGAPLERFDPWVVDRLTELLEETYVRSGQVLWAQGAVVESLYFMLEGQVRSHREGSVPWTFEGRWFLGSFEGHLDRPATRTLEAVTDFSALRIPRRAWLDLLEDSFELTQMAIQSAAGAVAGLDARLPSLARPPELAAPTLTGQRGPERPLGVVERIAFLAERQMARGAGVQALADLATASKEVRLGPGETLFNAEAPHPEFFLVVDGVVEARRTKPDLVRTYVRGELVTGAAALSDHGRHWGARARGPARVLAIPLEAWFDLIEEHFDLAHSTLSVIAFHRERILEQLATAAGPDGLVLR